MRTEVRERLSALHSKNRYCALCMTSINGRSLNAIYCKDCATLKQREKSARNVRAYRERQQTGAVAQRQRTIIPLQQLPIQERPKYETPKPRPAKCELSPTGAHHRICTRAAIPGLSHLHEKQECKYCGDIIWTPCPTCNQSKNTTFVLNKRRVS